MLACIRNKLKRYCQPPRGSPFFQTVETRLPAPRMPYGLRDGGSEGMRTSRVNFETIRSERDEAGAPASLIGDFKVNVRVHRQTFQYSLGSSTVVAERSASVMTQNLTSRSDL